jgi:hypothetical protein
VYGVIKIQRVIVIQKSKQLTIAGMTVEVIVVHSGAAASMSVVDAVDFAMILIDGASNKINKSK